MNFETLDRGRRWGPAGGWFASLLLLAAAAAGAQSAQTTAPLEIDRSNGSYSGTVWLVASRSDAAPADQFVGIGIARLPGGPLEHSFAMRSGAGAAQLGDAENVAGLVGSGRAVVEVKVGPRAHDEVRHLVARWQAGEQGGDRSETPPPLVIENLLDRAARSIGLKTPYRSVLSGPDPIAYLRDLARINGGG